jgi:hypothetical protein
MMQTAAVLLAKRSELQHLFAGVARGHAAVVSDAMPAGKQCSSGTVVVTVLVLCAVWRTQI